LTAISARPELAALAIADPSERWQALGFHVRHDRVQLGGIELRLGAVGDGITEWTLRGVEPVAEIDGLQTRVIDSSVRHEPGDGSVIAHPNGAIALDHVVILTADFDRTAQALAEQGMPLRRLAERNGARQGFRRLGPAIMEIVQAPDGPTRFWGLVVIVADLEALAQRLGEHLGSIRPAVQPGRRIAALRGSAGLFTAVAFMDPDDGHRAVYPGP
jgi:catechol 2,3-dioxygenase-like lactoylglutathione lyase family enzyme